MKNRNTRSSKCSGICLLFCKLPASGHRVEGFPEPGAGGGFTHLPGPAPTRGEVRGCGLVTATVSLVQGVATGEAGEQGTGPSACLGDDGDPSPLLRSSGVCMNRGGLSPRVWVWSRKGRAATSGPRA